MWKLKLTNKWRDSLYPLIQLLILFVFLVLFTCTYSKKNDIIMRNAVVAQFYFPDSFKGLTYILPYKFNLEINDSIKFEIDSLIQYTKPTKIHYSSALQNTKPKIDEIITELKTAQITYNTPERMIVGEIRQIVLLISLEKSDSLKRALTNSFNDTSKIGKIYQATAKATEKMEAHLTGLGFTITPITEVAQLIKVNNATRWEWAIKANEPGTHTLYLTVNAYINYNGENITQTIETFRKEIIVEIDKSKKILEWIDKNISWIAGILCSLISLFIGYFLANLKENKRKKEELKKSLIIKPDSKDEETFSSKIE